MGVIYRRLFDRAELADRFPPQFTHPNKVAFSRQVAGDPVPGYLEVSRWATEELPESRSPWRPRLVDRPGYFTYDEADAPLRRHWHLNFAHYDLFSAYAGPLLAQDEMQVLEHPDLVSVRQALVAERLSTLVTENGMATPILVSGVPRRGVIDTGPTPERPGGLYGNRFAAASVSQVLAATTRLNPPTISKVLAMEAPAYGRGAYRQNVIVDILKTAITGFGAAVTETRSADPDGATVVHTGWWGCGAYGGNQELMAMLQLLAAEWAEVDEVVFHLGSADTRPILTRAVKVRESLPVTTAELVAAIADRGYLWGVSDGN